MIAAASWIVPTTFAQWVKHTSRVRGVSSGSRSSACNAAVPGRKRHSRTWMPSLSSSRHGPMLASWSRLVTTMSVAAPHVGRSARASSRRLAVVEAPSTTSPGSAFTSRSAARWPAATSAVARADNS